MNEQDQKLWNECTAKYNVDPEMTEYQLTLYGGMYYSILANNHWKTPASTREDKIRDCMKTTQEGKAVVEYVVRHDYPQLIWVLEE